MKNASLIGLIGAIILVVVTLIWWIAPYSLYEIGSILSIAAYLCIGYYFLKTYKVYRGK